MKLTKITACAAALLTAAVAVTTSAGCGKDNPADETTVEQTAETTVESFETTTANAGSETVPSAETDVATTTNDADAAEQSTAESTTEKENETVTEKEKTTAAENAENTSSDSVTENSAGNENEFNIVITDNFYMTGESIDADGTVTPLEIAKTSKSLYMLSDFDGIAMGALINGETAYMICPEKKIYLEITAALSKTMGLDDSDMFDVSSYSFADIGSLSNAKSTEQDVDFQGVKCTAYTFDRETSQSVFYMNGNKLVGFVTANLDGSDPVTTVVSSVAADVPADRIEPPAEYKSYKGVIGAVRFMAALGIKE